MNLLLKWLFTVSFILSVSLESINLLIIVDFIFVLILTRVSKSSFFQGGEDLKSNNEKWSPFYFWLHSQMFVL